MTDEKLVEKVLQELEGVAGTDQVRRDLDLSLFGEDLLDSLGTITLMLALGEAFHIEISPAEIDRELWATPHKIIQYIETRVQR